jgi:hypothetical protein
LSLITAVHEFAYANTETYDEVGKDLAYLFAAIAAGSYVEWTRFDVLPELFVEHLDAECTWAERLLGYVAMTPAIWEEQES